MPWSDTKTGWKTGSRDGLKTVDRRSTAVDVRIGIVQSVKELEVELGEDVGREVIMGDIEEALQNPEGVLWLTDRKGRRVAVPVAKIAYIEVGAPVSERRVGFGAP
jgi:fructose-specific component phosphotransferase system IIB-like protein